MPFIRGSAVCSIFKTVMPFLCRITLSSIYLSSQNKATDPGPEPPNYLKDQISFQLPVLFDGVPLGKSFGDVHKDAEPSYNIVRHIILCT